MEHLITNYIEPHKMRDHWDTHDILLLIFDISKSLLPNSLLTSDEINHIKLLKSEHFIRRFSFSRVYLKLALQEIFPNKSLEEISLSKNRENRIRVNNSDFPWISLSYSHPFMALLLAKKKATNDVEVVRPHPIYPNKYPAFFGLQPDATKENQIKWWERWTRMEAYTKYQGIPLPVGFRDISFASGLFFLSFLINSVLVCSICTETERPNIEILSWR